MEENIIDKQIGKDIESKLLTEDTIFDISELFKVFGDSTRVKIINVLLENKLCVGDIEYLNYAICCISSTSYIKKC